MEDLCKYNLLIYNKKRINMRFLWWAIKDSNF